jgi:hypothetical protein
MALTNASAEGLGNGKRAGQAESESVLVATSRPTGDQPLAKRLARKRGSRRVGIGPEPSRGENLLLALNYSIRRLPLLA